MNKPFRKIILAVSFVSILASSCKVEKDVLITIKTPYGDMKAILYEETPLHKKNFIELAKSGQYDSTIFHRVIKEFMIQGGDINAKANNTKRVDYTIPAEFNTQFFHKKGALSAARMGDNVNPNKESSGCQFYIVHGRKFTAEELDQMATNANQYALQTMFGRFLQMPENAELRSKVIGLQNARDMSAINALIDQLRPILETNFGKITEKSYSEIQKSTYADLAGAPHLDNDYTVFGQVVEGLEVIDSIASVQTGGMDKPLNDVPLTMVVEEISRKQITEKYGYIYPVVEK